MWGGGGLAPPPTLFFFAKLDITHKDDLNFFWLVKISDKSSLPQFQFASDATEMYMYQVFDFPICDLYTYVFLIALLFAS